MWIVGFRKRVHVQLVHVFSVGLAGALQPVYLADIESAAPSLRMLLEDGDVLITLGAGSVGSLAPRLPALLGQEAISDVG